MKMRTRWMKGFFTDVHTFGTHQLKRAPELYVISVFSAANKLVVVRFQAHQGAALLLCPRPGEGVLEVRQGPPKILSHVHRQTGEETVRQYQCTNICFSSVTAIALAHVVVTGSISWAIYFSDPRMYVYIVGFRFHGGRGQTRLIVREVALLSRKPRTVDKLNAATSVSRLLRDMVLSS